MRAPRLIRHHSDNLVQPRSQKAAVVRACAQPVVEALEGRQFFAAQLSSEPAIIMGPTLVQTRAITSPSVRTVDPANGETNVHRDAFVSTELNLVNGGVNPTTLGGGNVKLTRVSDGTTVAGRADTSGGGDTIVFTPSSLLTANTQYRFTVTTGVKDVNGNAFAAFTSTFTTGTLGGPSVSNVAFTKAAQAVPSKAYTCVTVGPDGRLYAAAYDGSITRFNVGNDGTLSGATTINSITVNNSGGRTITGIVFDPSSTASNLIAWVTHTQRADFNGTDFTGKITRLTGPQLGQYQDFVTNLPRSVRDHLTDQGVFGPDGAFYVSQAASNAMGAPDSAWGNRPEHLLTAAVLRVNLNAIATRIANGQGPLNVKSVDAGGTYDPYAAGAPVTLYATGVRNAYDMVWASNGHLYAAVNGSAAGGNSPASSNTGRRPPSGTPYSGPFVPGITNNPAAEHDWIFDVKSGGYYGHPNPTRGEFALDGANPTSGKDPQEVAAYPVGTQPDANYRLPAYDFGAHYSPDGIIQYKSSTFGGALAGKLLVVRYSGGDDIIVLSPTSGGSIDKSQTLTGLTGFTGFTDPVDLTEYVNPANAADPRNGMLFVAEYGGKKITLLRPGKGGPTSAPTLAGLTLMNAANDTDIGPFVNNQQIDLSGGKQFTVRADAGTGTLGSVVFKVDGVIVRTESFPPYSIGGETNGNYDPWNVPTGTHTLTVIPFTDKSGGGTAGTPITFSFTATGTGTVGNSFAGVAINGATGSVSTPATNAWVVKGQGFGLTGAKDQFFFAQQSRSGDFDIKAKLTQLSGGAAGLVLRTGTAAGNSEVSIQFANGNLVYGSRDGFGTNFTSSAVGSGTVGSIWLRLKRVGTTITAFFGTTGTTWTTAGSTSLTGLASVANLGFSVAGTSLMTAKFEQVTSN